VAAKRKNGAKPESYGRPPRGHPDPPRVADPQRPDSADPYAGPGAAPVPHDRTLKSASIRPGDFTHRALFSVPLTVTTRHAALSSLRHVLEHGTAASGLWVAFLNANNFNAAMRCEAYRKALSSAYAVYPDGVAIEIAARLAGIERLQNLPGTDLVPELLAHTADGLYRCYLLGETQQTVESAARYVECRFPGWRIAGVASGYFASDEAEARTVRSIAEAAPDLLLIGMGTPKQEHFVARHGPALRARLTIGVGGLFQYWSRKLVRAPRAVRALRLEWLWILAQQPHKWRRYTIGIAWFFATVVRLRLAPPRAAP
jgi:N-acetylglucosaminyldiphosphoundecaprenol N-acetyl-beta-D-mannosaminyltransferase